MRLIDADALIKEVMERYCNDCERRKGVKNGKWKIVYSIGDAPCRACGIGDMTEELEDAPTVEERKKGKRIIEPYDDDSDMKIFRCPICLKPSGIGGKRRSSNKWEWFDFCPNCGTDMRDRQRATWELDEKSNRHRCSECLSVASRDDNGAESLSDYCGVCGARMEKA